jgi:DNA-binding NtrC family response regulator
VRKLTIRRAADGSLPVVEAILLVDNDPAVGCVLRALVGAEQRLIVTADSAQVMALLDTHAVGVMLCNEHLEGQENGLYLLARVRERHPLIQLVLMSEGVDEALLAFAINEVGVLKYLKKPLVFEQVRKALDGALRHYRQAVEIDQLRSGYRQMAKEMRGLPYRVRRLRRGARLVIRHGRDLLLASATALVALQAVFLGVGLIVLAALYLVKSALGIDIMANLHLQDLLDR